LILTICVVLATRLITIIVVNIGLLLLVEVDGAAVAVAVSYRSYGCAKL
jgi:hypothetical protein